MGYFATAPHLDRVLVVYSLVAAGIAEVAYLYSVWPDLTLWSIVIATGLASITVVEVYLVCIIGLRLLAVWVDQQLPEVGDE